MAKQFEFQASKVALVRPGALGGGEQRFPKSVDAACNLHVRQALLLDAAVKHRQQRLLSFYI